MARARNIKPALFKNELLGVADPLLTLLFQSLWTLADKEGRLEDRPLRIKAETFPYRDGLDVNGYLTELQRLGFIVRYSVDGLALIQVVNFKKHQTPHNTEKPSELPPVEAGTVAGCSLQAASVKSPLDNREKSEALPPDSLVLIPSSLIPDSLNPIPSSSPSATASVGEVVSLPFPKDNPSPNSVPEIREAKQETDLQAACRETWASYARAYFEKYNTEPVRNAKVSGQVKQFVQRIGQAEAPEVAAYFLTHPDSFYVRKLHDFGLLLADAEKIRTEWATGRKVTGTRAKQTEQTGTMIDIVAEIQRERGQA